MKTIQELRDERKAHLEKAEAIAKRVKDEARSYTTDEQKDFDEHMTATDNIDAEIVTIEADASRAARLESAKAKEAEGAGRAVDPGQPRSFAQPSDPAPWERYARFGGLRSFTGDNAMRRAYESGQWILANLLGNERAAKWCKDHGIAAESRALATNVNVSGGVLVPSQFANTIIDLRDKYGVFRQNVQVVPMTSDYLEMPRVTGGTTAYFLAENGAFTESEPTWDNISLTAKKIGVMTRYSSEIAEDAAISIADWLANESALAFAYKEDICGFNGTGAQTTYGGIYGATVKIVDGNHNASLVSAATGHDLMSEIDGTDLASALAKVPLFVRQRGNIKWYCSQVFKALVFDRLLASAGGNSNANVSGMQPDSYLGYPIVVTPVLPTATTTLSGSLMAMVGDLSLAAMLGTRREIRMTADTSRYVEYDQVAFLANERFDINVHDLGDGTNAGPIVALKGA